MADITAESVREAFGDDYEVYNVEANRSQYRVFLAEGSPSGPEAEDLLRGAFGDGSVFGVSVSDERPADEDETMRVVSFRAR